MKTLYKFIFKSYVGPFVLTLFIAMFVFFMMFIFKYIDDFVGKGIEASILAELFFYFSLTTIPMALPLAILLSSLMTFGNLGEHFELTAMKSAGVSLQKIMAPLIFTTICLAIGAFYFSNNILPYTNLKAGSLLYDVRESKPALMFKEGVFNNSIEGISIRVGKKERDGKTLKDIMIYDHRKMEGNRVVLTAKSGKMEETPDKMFLILTLRDGVSYKELLSTEKDYRTRPLVRDKFEERVVRMDLSEFKMSRTNEELFKSNYQMMTLSQLTVVSDSLKVRSEKRKMEFGENLVHTYYRNSITLMMKSDSLQNKNTSVYFFDKLSMAQQLSVIESASNMIRNVKIASESMNADFENIQAANHRCDIEWHKKFTLSIACVVLFFIGAPLGAIIRKGGLGMPVVVSVIFFIIFHIISISGEKLSREGEIPAYQGMWLATIVLFPIGVFLTKKATSDADLFDASIYLNFFKKLFSRSEKTIQS